jgi:hypothetical protein
MLHALVVVIPRSISCCDLAFDCRLEKSVATPKKGDVEGRGEDV